jgi:hypothetical protein
MVATAGAAITRDATIGGQCTDAAVRIREPGEQIEDIHARSRSRDSVRRDRFVGPVSADYTRSGRRRPERPGRVMAGEYKANMIR